MSKKSFQNSEYYDRILKVRDFMFDDIDKTVELQKTQRGAPNFLLALGLCCYTEYWGKLLLGTEKKDHREASKVPYEEFLKRLDRRYYEDLFDLLAEQDLDVYYNIRCGLAHAYLIEGGRDATISIGDLDHHGIEYNVEKRKYTFWVRAYFEEFKKAVNCYIKGLEEGTESLEYLESALRSRPELI
jgi:hypothetical protein